MVCDDCKSKLSVLSAPDPWKSVSGGAVGPDRRVNENKLLRKGLRANPYGAACKICKLKTQQNSAMYCSICAYAKGCCAICGKQVLDTTMYAMREGGNQWHTVRSRDAASFKSADQIAREEAQEQLFAHLEATGQVGRMPTRRGLESAGKKALADQLVQTFGGLHAAADALSLSKRNLIEEAEERKERKQQAAQRAGEESQLPPPQQDTAAALGGGEGRGSVTGGGAGGCSVSGSMGGGVGGGADGSACGDWEDRPPGIGVGTGGGAAIASRTPDAGAGAVAPSRHALAQGKPTVAPVSSDASWHYDPNTGFHYQLSSGVYYDHKSKSYSRGGVWSKHAPSG
jgi:hypothetical protein